MTAAPDGTTAPGPVTSDPRAVFVADGDTVFEVSATAGRDVVHALVGKVVSAGGDSFRIDGRATTSARRVRVAAPTPSSTSRG